MPIGRRLQASLSRRRVVPAQLYGSATASGSGDWRPGWGIRPARTAAPIGDAAAELARRRAAAWRPRIVHLSPIPTPEYVAALSNSGFGNVPRELPDHRLHRTQIANAVNRTLGGKLNNTGDMTLAANSSATILKDKRLSAKSAILFEPMTANAAAEMAAGTMYITAANRRNEAFTITHSNAASTDRTFRYAILG